MLHPPFLTRYREELTELPVAVFALGPLTAEADEVRGMTVCPQGMRKEATFEVVDEGSGEAPSLAALGSVSSAALHHAPCPIAVVATQLAHMVRPTPSRAS